MSEATPRITAAHLDPFRGRTVMIVGKVVQLRAPHATLDSNGTVTIQMGPESHLRVNNYAEILGKVQNDLSIRMLGSKDLGQDVDFAAYEAVVDVTHRYKDMFYSD